MRSSRGSGECDIIKIIGNHLVLNNRVLRLPALIVLLTRRFDPETRAFFGYTSKLSNRRIYTFMLLCLGVATYRAKIVLKKC